MIDRILKCCILCVSHCALEMSVPGLAPWRAQLGLDEKWLDAIGPNQLNPPFFWTSPSHPTIVHQIPRQCPRVQKTWEALKTGTLWDILRHS